MKEIHVRRHAPKNADGTLTEEGKMLALHMKEHIGQFDLVISSQRPRAIETAKLLTGINPVVDQRAGPAAISLEQEKELHMLGKNHPFGIAGVILDTPAYRPLIRERGEQLIELIKETLGKLSNNGRALIISHDGVMVAADILLRNKPFLKAEKTYEPLRGFCAQEDLTVIDLE